MDENLQYTLMRLILYVKKKAGCRSSYHWYANIFIHFLFKTIMLKYEGLRKYCLETHIVS